MPGVGKIALQYVPLTCLILCVLMWCGVLVVLQTSASGLRAIGPAIWYEVLRISIYAVSLFGSIAAVMTSMSMHAQPGTRSKYIILLFLNLLFGVVPIHCMQIKEYFAKNPPLVRVAKGGNEQRIRALLVADENPAQPSDEAVWAFQVAVDQSDYEMLHLFLDFFSKSENQAITLEGALRSSVQKGKTVLIEKLLEEGADPNSKTGNVSVLTIAVKKGYQGIIELLLRAGADPRQTDSTVEVLFYAIMNSDTDGVTQWIGCLEESYFLHEPQTGSRFLCIALKRNRDLEIVKLLLEAGADPAEPTRSGIAPLATAVKKNRAGAVRLFLKNGTNPNDTRITTNLLKLVEDRGYTEIEEILREHGALPPSISSK